MQLTQVFKAVVPRSIRGRLTMVRRALDIKDVKGLLTIYD